MCGITGVFLAGEAREQGGAAAVRRETVERMTQVLEHRGPDDYGAHVKGPIGLGFRRLSIIGLASGTSRSHRGGTPRVICNGEIDNYLRSARAGKRWPSIRTETDTECSARLPGVGRDSGRRLSGSRVRSLDEGRGPLPRPGPSGDPSRYTTRGTAAVVGVNKAILKTGLRGVTSIRSRWTVMTYLYVTRLAPSSANSKLRPGHT